MGWKESAGSVVSGGGTVKNPLQGVQDLGGDAATGVKSLGKGFSDLNPFKKPDLQDMPDIVAPKDVTAPTGPTGSAPTMGGPTAFTGATIGGPTADPRAALIDMSAQNQFRDQQMTLAQSLAQQAAGQGPSLAGQMLRQGAEANTAATFAQLASQRGGPSAMGARSAMQNASQIQAQTSRDAANARIQEQLAAREQLAGVLNTGRQGDISLATSQAQMQQEANMTAYKGQLEKAIAQGQLDQQTASQMFQAAQEKAKQNVQMQMQFEQLKAQYAAMGLDAQRANQLAALEVQRMQQGQVAAENANTMSAHAGNQAMIGGILGAGATLGAAGIKSGTPGTTTPATSPGNTGTTQAHGGPGWQSGY